MAKVKHPYDHARDVPWVGRNVQPGEVVEVPDGDLPSYLEAGWTVDKPSKQNVKES